MKAISKILIILGLTGIGGTIILGCIYSTIYSINIESYLRLSYKAPTIEQSSMYFDKYIEGIEKANLSGYDAVIFKLPDDSYAENYKVVKEYQNYLHAIQKMDVNSIEYQIAIKKLSNSALKLSTDAISNIWIKNNCIVLWTPMLIFLIPFYFSISFVGLMLKP